MSLLIKLCGSGSASASCGRRSLVQQAASSARRPKPASVFPAVSTPVASSRLVFTKGLPRIAVGGSCLQPPQHVLCHSNNRTVVARSPILSRQVAQLSGISGCPLAPRAVAARYSVSRYRRDGSGEELLGAGWQLPLPPLQLSLPQVLHQQRRSMMSEGAKGGGAQSEGAGPKSGGPNEDGPGGDQQPGEEEEKHSVMGVFQLILMLCILALVAVAAFYITLELFPSRMAPNTVMNRAHGALMADPDTANHFGTPLKAYGQDNNRKREGRRHHVEHEEYKVEADGSKRTRVRFNVEGPHGHGMAYAEVSNKMTSGEWVYLCVQDLQTGHVITLQDNRAMLATQAQAGSQEEKDAYAAMLGKSS